jgi:hypothetical protein
VRCPVFKRHQIFNWHQLQYGVLRTTGLLFG